MKKHMSTWEWDHKLDQPRPGLKQQKLVTYQVREDGSLVKETVTRRFYGDDYQDSLTTEVISAAD